MAAGIGTCHDTAVNEESLDRANAFLAPWPPWLSGLLPQGVRAALTESLKTLQNVFTLRRESSSRETLENDDTLVEQNRNDDRDRRYGPDHPVVEAAAGVVE